jgi:glycine cleavage system H protein
MKISDIEFPDDLYYDQRHSWAHLHGEILRQGLSEFGQRIAKEVIFIEIPRIGRTVRQGETLLSMESGKWVGRVPAMASGKIIKVNEELEYDPRLVNESPYHAGWLVEIKINDVGELDHLMRSNSQVFIAFIELEKEKYKSLFG